MKNNHCQSSPLRFEALEARQLLSVTDVLGATSDVACAAAADVEANTVNETADQLLAITSGEADALVVTSEGCVMDVRWEAIEGAKFYEVQYKLDSADYWYKRFAFGTDCKLVGILGQDYDVRVKAFGAADETFVTVEDVSLIWQPILLKSDVTSSSLSINVYNYLRTNLSEEGRSDRIQVDIKVNGETFSVRFNVNDTEAAEIEGLGAYASFNQETGMLDITALPTGNTWYDVSVRFMTEDLTDVSGTGRIFLYTPYANPVDVAVEALSATELKVDWAFVEGQPVPTFCTVQYSADGGKTWRTATSVATGTEYTIKYLKADTNYLVRVYATGGKPTALLGANTNAGTSTLKTNTVYSISANLYSPTDEEGHTDQTAIHCQITGKDASGNTYEWGLLNSISLSCRFTGWVTSATKTKAKITTSPISLINHDSQNVYYAGTLIGTVKLHGNCLCFELSSNFKEAQLSIQFGSTMTFANNTDAYVWRGRAFNTNSVYVKPNTVL